MIESPIGGDAAQRRLPEVEVAVDESGHGDLATAIDLHYRPAAQVATDRDDLAVVDQYVAGLDDAELRIH
jgi:hypothetical protein